jgi:hypothetical protein
LSVAELRRKAHEHSAALLHSLHAASLAFPGFPLHSVLNNSRKTNDFINDLSMHHHLHNNNNSIQNNNNNTVSENTGNMSNEDKTNGA